MSQIQSIAKTAYTKLLPKEELSKAELLAKQMVEKSKKALITVVQLLKDRSESINKVLLAAASPNEAKATSSEFSKLANMLWHIRDVIEKGLLSTVLSYLSKYSSDQAAFMAFIYRIIVGTSAFLFSDVIGDEDVENILREAKKITKDGFMGYCEIIEQVKSSGIAESMESSTAISLEPIPEKESNGQVFMLLPTGIYLVKGAGSEGSSATQLVIYNNCIPIKPIDEQMPAIKIEGPAEKAKNTIKALRSDINFRLSYLSNAFELLLYKEIYKENLTNNNETYFTSLILLNLSMVLHYAKIHSNLLSQYSADSLVGKIRERLDNLIETLKREGIEFLIPEKMQPDKHVPVHPIILSQIILAAGAKGHEQLSALMGIAAQDTAKITEESASDKQSPVYYMRRLLGAENRIKHAIIFGSLLDQIGVSGSESDTASSQYSATKRISKQYSGGQSQEYLVLESRKLKVINPLETIFEKITN